MKSLSQYWQQGSKLGSHPNEGKVLLFVFMCFVRSRCNGNKSDYTTQIGLLLTNFTISNYLRNRFSGLTSSAGILKAFFLMLFCLFPIKRQRYSN